MLEAIKGLLRRPNTTVGPRPIPELPPIGISLDQRCYAVVEAALALNRTTNEYDSNAFLRTTEAHARLRQACNDLDAHWSKIVDNPFARNRVSEELEAELPKTGVFISPAFA